MQYDDIYEMLEAVRTYELQGKERIRPCNSIKGTEVGYCTADTEGATTRWVIRVEDLKASASKELVTRMRGYQERRKLLEDLRSGKYNPKKEAAEKFFVESEKDLPEGPTTLAVDPDSDEVADFLDMLE